ncbi:MAG: phage Gp37/Gp68 family protein [Acidobacteria bacterium]|nr:phage Gp37/Gp68 family protein [Acidobacteriota bacterium]
MAEISSIEWTDSTWNPVRGCTKVSPGCKHCYAQTFAERWRGIPGHPYEQGFDLRLVPEKLEEPLRWKSPRRVFVNSMSDLFHEAVPEDYIRRVFEVMGAAHWHTFQVLTKRAERLAALAPHLPWPENVWQGVSVESERYLPRIASLQRVDAAVRFLSLAPLLEPLPRLHLDGISWVIVGGESGLQHRLIEVEWVRAIRDQCVRKGVAFFFKQWGGRTPKAGGRRLDGKEWNQMPLPLRRPKTRAS